MTFFTLNYQLQKLSGRVEISINFSSDWRTEKGGAVVATVPLIPEKNPSIEQPIQIAANITALLVPSAPDFAMDALRSSQLSHTGLAFLLIPKRLKETLFRKQCIVPSITKQS